MNFKGYIKKFGKYDFQEKAFNNVDGTLLAFLTYPNWDLYVSDFTRDHAHDFYIKNITDEMIKPLTKKTTLPFELKKVLKEIVKSNRYSNILLKYCVNKYDIKRKQQFFAITFEIPELGNYIAFRGTDLSVVGWEENLIISLDVVTPSQTDSVEYIRKVSELIDGDFYVGGHSKGGNLAMYSSINVEEKIQNRIRKVFSLDGTGFYKDYIYKTENYKRIEGRILQIIPSDSFVGVIFYTPKYYRVVSSRYLSVLQHTPYSWRIKSDGTFKYRKHRTYMSLVRHRALRIWVDQAPFETKALTIDAIVTAFGGNDKTVLHFLRHPGFITRTITVLKKKYTKEQKIIMIKFASQLVKMYISSFFYYLSTNNRKDTK